MNYTPKIDEKIIYDRLCKVEQHVINLLVPIQNIANVLSKTEVLDHLVNILHYPLKIDDTNVSAMMKEIKGCLNEFKKNIEKVNEIQNLSEIKYIGKRLWEIENLLKNDNQNKKVNLDLQIHCDGYELVKKPISYDKEEPIFPSNDDVLDKVLFTIDERERTTVILRLGLKKNKIHTFAEMAKLMGLCRGRPNLIYQKALRKLRHLSRIELVKKTKNKELIKAVCGE